MSSRAKLGWTRAACSEANCTVDASRRHEGLADQRAFAGVPKVSVRPVNHALHPLENRVVRDAGMSFAPSLQGFSLAGLAS